MRGGRRTKACRDPGALTSDGTRTERRNQRSQPASVRFRSARRRLWGGGGRRPVQRRSGVRRRAAVHGVIIQCRRDIQGVGVTQRDQHAEHPQQQSCENDGCEQEAWRQESAKHAAKMTAERGRSRGIAGRHRNSARTLPTSTESNNLPRQGRRAEPREEGRRFSTPRRRRHFAIRAGSVGLPIGVPEACWENRNRGASAHRARDGARCGR
jgi:hypothetical protein